MSLVFRYATILVRDVPAMGKFWSAATGGRGSGAGVGAFIQLAEGEDGPGILLQEDDSATPRDTGLAFRPPVGTLAAEVGRLMALGASVVRKLHQGWGLGEVTMADPEGNQFIVASSVDEIQDFESGGEESALGRCPSHPFWADAEQAPDRSGHGSTMAVVEAPGR